MFLVNEPIDIVSKYQSKETYLFRMDIKIISLIFSVTLVAFMNTKEGNCFKIIEDHGGK